jgi:hypothetical protein
MEASGQFPSNRIAANRNSIHQCSGFGEKPPEAKARTCPSFNKRSRS